MAPKDHKAYQFTSYPPYSKGIHDWYRWIAEVEKIISETNMVDAIVEHEDWDATDYVIVKGWIPLTDREKERAKAKRAKETARRRAAKQEKEEAERAELRRLAVLYPEEI